MGDLLDAAIAPLISAAAAVLVSVINSIYQSNTTRNLIEYKIAQLTKQVEKHNNVIERVYNLERHQDVVDEQIKVANHRIKDIEDENNKR